jgi:hypothetical protein
MGPSTNELSGLKEHAQGESIQSLEEQRQESQARRRR